MLSFFLILESLNKIWVSFHKFALGGVIIRDKVGSFSHFDIHFFFFFFFFLNEPAIYGLYFWATLFK